MDRTITQHLKKISIKPRGDNFFKSVASELSGETIDDPKEAKVLIRKAVSEGQKEASNDNHSGLDRQVKMEIKEQNGGGVIGDEYAYIFQKPKHTKESSELFLRNRGVKFGKPQEFKNAWLLPLRDISRNGSYTSRPLEGYDGVHLFIDNK